MLLSRAIVMTILSTLSPGQAHAACVCRCVDGTMTVVCEHIFDTRPICFPTDCHAAPPAANANCDQRQVFNRQTGKFEQKTICF
jgi:hypothetical protein